MAVTFVGSTGGSAINGGNVTLTLPGTYHVGDVAYVAVTLGTSKTTTLAVNSSASVAYTQVVTTIVSSMVRFGVFRQVITSTSSMTQAVVTGTGGSTDGTSAAIMIFDGAELSTSPEDVTATSTTGNSASPGSPAITVVSCSDAIITAVGFGLTNALTAPSSFLNATQAAVSDTHPSNTAMAWITNATTAAITPGAWTSTGVAAGWCSATIAVHPSLTWGADFEPGINTATGTVNEQRRIIVRSY